ncbi:MAG: iron response transcriptional regulator IrrA [Alphaproteobacteria bacterium]
MNDMAMNDMVADIAEKLRNAGLRPTKQRVLLASLLFKGGDMHFTAESLYEQCRAPSKLQSFHSKDEKTLSLATVYNNLHQFLQAGIIRQVPVEGKLGYFDTNVTHHHHFFYEEEGRLQDIPAEEIAFLKLPNPPAGQHIHDVEILIRLKAGNIT